MPVIVHNRRSNDVMLRTLREQRFDGLGGVFHSFAGGLQMALEILDRDFTIGFSGMVTFRAADNVREVLAVLPLDKILVETDTPYLTPEPFRGQPNRPVFVVEVVKRIAEERESTFAEIALSTTHNFSALFPKAIRSD
jgi:TatD DNase family protein